MTDLEELEFAARQYEVVTEHLIEVLNKYDTDEVPQRIRVALMTLAVAINESWG